MTSPMAFRATYADWKLIKTRGVVQVVMEVPLADSDAAYDVLGGMPNPANETWFGIAPLKLGKEAMPDIPREQIHPTNPGPDNARPLPDTDKPSAGAKREKMDWREVQPAAQAGIRCAEPTFRAFIREKYNLWARNPEEAAVAVREICNVKSRAELGTNHTARVIWHQLDTEYQAWLQLERV